MERRSGLGRGLGALIPADVAAGAGGPPGVREVPISQIEPNPYQPRNHFDEESLAGLTASIRELGVLQPVLVRELGARALRAHRRRAAVAGGQAGRPPVSCRSSCATSATS